MSSPTISQTLASYVGRLADFLVLRTDAQGVVTMAMVEPADGGQICVGLQKLFQRYLLILCTKKGSMLYLPDFGCQFLIDFDAGNWRTVADVYQSFISSQLDVKRQLFLDELDTDPPDEDFFTANLLNVTLTGEQVAITIQVVSLAGESATYIVPIVTIPQ
jgi:hypothetical protein